MARLSLTVEYEGTRYHGFQIQTGVPTIQGEIERALWRSTGERIRIIGASRTDAGAHAKEQVISFSTGSNLRPQTLVKALNFYLPQDIAARSATMVSDNFDARRDAISREYRYTIFNAPARSPLHRRYAMLVPVPIDIEAMVEACQVLVGQHDFAPLAGPLTRPGSTVRTVHQARVQREGKLIFFNMEANSFLPQQVRRTIGALLRVGTGKMQVEQFQEIVVGSKKAAVPTAPAHGLCLMKVNYQELTRPIGR